MQIVLLGGAGYIGSVAARHLTALGHHVTVVDGLIYQRDDDPTRLLPTASTFVNADLRDPIALRHAMAGAEVVVHMGAWSASPHALSMSDWLWNSTMPHRCSPRPRPER